MLLLTHSLHQRTQHRKVTRLSLGSLFPAPFERGFGTFFQFLLRGVLHGLTNGPVVTEGVGELTVEVAPELLHERHRSGGSSGDGLIPGFLSIFNLKVQGYGRTAQSFRRVAFAPMKLGKVVGEE